jgi:type IV secretory pathway VirB10-like protein
MATARDLIVTRKPRRSFNVVALLILLAVLMLLVAAALALLMHVNTQAYTATDGGPNGTPSTLKAADVPGPDPSALRSPVAFVPLRAQSTTPPAPVVTAVPQRASGDDGSAAREAARQRAEEARRKEEARQQRLADAMRSMGGVALADPTEDDAQVQPAVAASPQEYGAPRGPVLGIGTQIPIALTQSLDSTFGGRFSVPVTADVRDERGDRVLIPRGSTCFGTTTQGGVDGQARIYGAVDLCKLPDLTRVSLDKFPLQDTDGATGLKARVDDHGAGRRNRGNAFASIPSMVAGTVIPGVGGMVASSAAYGAAQSSEAGRAIPGPTLYVDASAQKPRAAFILVTHDVLLGEGSE